MFALPYKTKQIFFVLIKISIVITALYFIYFKLNNNKALQLSYFFELTNRSNVFSVVNTTTLLLLTGFNWFFEFLKWKTLVKPLRHISLPEATQQSLGALTVSIFTPNRIGEYGAKALFYNKAQTKYIVSINGLHNLLQLSVTLIFGTIGLIFFSFTYHLNINYTKPISVFIICILLGYILLSKIRFKKSHWLTMLVNFIKHYPKSALSLGFCFSVIRYLIFSFQFYYLLLTFNIDINYINAMLTIFSMYLLASIIPTMAIFEFIIKGSIAVYLFSFHQINTSSIVCITALMWVLNFALPSFIGSYFILNFKWPKKSIQA